MSLIMNKMKEQDVYEAIDTCFDHPNLEIVQVAEKTVDKK